MRVENRDLGMDIAKTMILGLHRAVFCGTDLARFLLGSGSPILGVSHLAGKSRDHVGC